MQEAQYLHHQFPECRGLEIIHAFIQIFLCVVYNIESWLLVSQGVIDMRLGHFHAFFFRKIFDEISRFLNEIILEDFNFLKPIAQIIVISWQAAVLIDFFHFYINK